MPRNGDGVIERMKTAQSHHDGQRGPNELEIYLIGHNAAAGQSPVWSCSQAAFVIFGIRPLVLIRH